MVATLALWAVLAAGAVAPADAQVVELFDRVRTLQVGLNSLDQVDGAAARALMQKHWGSVQDYMAALARVMPPVAEPPAGEPDCRVGDAWTALALPADVDVFRYRSVMHAMLLRMQRELIDIQNSDDATERALRAQAHWNAAYEDLQDLRGLRWLFSRWLPDPRDGRVLPEPASAGAKFVARYCTQCHAAPPPSLHTRIEWKALVDRMSQHMARSDTPIPQCVTVASPAATRELLEYLERHAR